MRSQILTYGAATSGVGIGLLVPALSEVAQGRPLSLLATGVVTLAGLLVVGGMAVLAWGVLQSRSGGLPPAVRAAVTANVLFLALFALEISDGLVRHGGNVHLISTSLFLPALGLLLGLIRGKRWSWKVARTVAAAAGLWFWAFILLIPTADLHGVTGPVPWWGRLYMICVSLALGGILLYACRLLGRADARRYFGVPPC